MCRGGGRRRRLRGCGSACRGRRCEDLGCQSQLTQIADFERNRLTGGISRSCGDKHGIDDAVDLVAAEPQQVGVLKGLPVPLDKTLVYPLLQGVVKLRALGGDEDGSRPGIERLAAPGGRERVRPDHEVDVACAVESCEERSCRHFLGWQRESLELENQPAGMNQIKKEKKTKSSIKEESVPPIRSSNAHLARLVQAYKRAPP